MKRRLAATAASLLNLSRVLHDAIYSDASQSLCARAWEYRETSHFWAAWVAVFGRRHCRKSWEYYRRLHANTPAK